MNSETLTAIAERYPWASWAVWDETFPDAGCIEEHPERLAEFIPERAELLTPDVVLMGLNRSDGLPAPFSNFHAATANTTTTDLRSTSKTVISTDSSGRI